MISMSIPGLGHEVIQFEKLMKRSGEYTHDSTPCAREFSCQQIGMTFLSKLCLAFRVVSLVSFEAGMTEPNKAHRHS